MEKRYTKLEGFTFMEILVVMLLSGIVLSAGYMGLKLLMHQEKRFNENIAVFEEIDRLEGLLIRDFDKCEYAIIEDSTLFCIGGPGNPEYQLHDSIIIRKVGHLYDTIFVHPISLSGMKTDKMLRDNLIDHVQLQISFHENKHSIIIRKKYGAGDFMGNSSIND